MKLYLSASTALLLALAAAAPAGCMESDGATNIQCAGKIVGGTCYPDYDNGGGGEPDSSGTPDGSTSKDEGGGGDGAGTGDGAANPDEGVDPEQSCDVLIAGTKPMGAGCTRHCECVTGYCYDEAYLGDFRFCTRSCDWDCNTDAPPGKEYTCMVLGGSIAQKHGLTQTSICNQVCKDVADCQKLSDQYDQCGSSDPPGSSATTWESSTLTLRPTCQISSEL